MIKTVMYEEQIVVYDLTYKWMKSLRARVKANGSLAVSAPYGCAECDIQAFLLSAMPRLLPAMQKAGEIAAARERHLADGDTVLLCGRPYTVRLVCGERCGVIEAGDELIITRPRRYKVEKDEACLYDYLAVQAKEIIDAAFRRIYAAHFENAFPAPCIRFRRVRSYWGMCYHTRGEIVFNTRLVQAPPAAIDYVVMHELVHMLHPDHGPRFYAALSVHMPDYKARIRSLKSVDLRRAPWQ